MELSDSDLEDFIEIVKHEYGMDLSREHAQIHAQLLLNLYELIRRPLLNEMTSKPPAENPGQTPRDVPVPEVL